MRTQGIGWQQLAQPNPHSAGLPEITITDENELMSKLRIEYLREFWGEGQIFFMYKRLFVNILNTENGHNTSTYGASAARYVPPMPAKEIENR